MQDQTELLRDRLQTLLEQVDRERGSVHQNAGEGKAAYVNLFDSLTATLHNLDRLAKVEQKL